MIDKKINIPFKVPESYFEDLENNLKSLVNIESLKSLKENEVPEGYFEQLENQVLSQYKINDLQKIESIKVPEAYFDKLEKNILSKTNTEKTIFKAFYKQNIFKYAAGIFITFGIGFSVYQKINIDTIDQLSSDEMISYLNEQSLNAEDLETIIEVKNISFNNTETELSAEEINAYNNEN